MNAFFISAFITAASTDPSCLGMTSERLYWFEAVIQCERKEVYKKAHQHLQASKPTPVLMIQLKGIFKTIMTLQLSSRRRRDLWILV